MRAARRRWCFLAALAVGAAVTAQCGGDADEPARRIGDEISFSVPASPGGAEQVRIQGIVRGQGAVGIVLAHMLGSSQSAWLPLVEELVKDGFHVLTFDFRGHGLSGGDRDVSRADLDLAGAVAKLRSLGAVSVFVVGASMGGTAALKVAAQEKLAGVVSISAPVEIGSLDASRAVRQLDEPSLFIVAERDDKRYRDAARSLHAAAPEPKRLQIVSGSSAHGTGLLIDGTTGTRLVRPLILDFIASHGG